MFLKNLFNTPTPTAERVLYELAWLVRPVDQKDDCPKLGQLLHIPTYKVVATIKQLVEEGKLVAFNTSRSIRTLYKLPPAQHLRMLADLHDHLDAWRQLLHWQAAPAGLNGWPSVMQDFIKTGKLPSSDIGIEEHWDHQRDESQILPLLALMPASAFWRPFFNALPERLICQAFEKVAVTWERDLLPPDHALIHAGYTNNEQLSAALRNMFAARYALAEYALPARLADVSQQQLPTASIEVQCLHALCLQYTGKNTEAIAAYQKALRGTGCPCFLDTFYDFYYLLALIREPGEAAHKKLDAISRNKKVCAAYTGHGVRGLLLDLALGENPDTDADIFVKGTYGTMDRVLSILITRHFHINTKQPVDEEWLTQTIGHDHLRLLQLECSLDFEPFRSQAEQLRQQTGLTPLLTHFHRKAQWEMAIEEVANMATPASEQGKKSKAQPKTRIVYHIGPYDNIIPKQQKSKDGISWTKGRNIALATFAEMLPEMNDTDRKLAKKVRADYYGGISLDSPAAFADLAGYPLVFSEEHPETPVVITQEEPHITISKTAEGFRVEHNLGPNPASKPATVTAENDFRYRVVLASNEQGRMVAALDKIGLFPPEAQQSLATLLPQLARAITIHSDLLPADEGIKRVEADPRITVLLQPSGMGFKAELFVKPLRTQPPYCHPGTGNTNVFGTGDNERLTATRDLAAERKQLLAAREWLDPLAEDIADEDCYIFEDMSGCLRLLDILRDHADTVLTEWPEGAKLRLRGRADLNNFHLNVGGAGQWFAVEGGVKIDGGTDLNLAQLLAGLSRSHDKRYVQLGEGEFIALSDKLRKQLNALEPLLTADKDGLHMPSMAAPALQSIVAKGATLQADNTFKALTRRINKAERQTFDVPDGLRAELRAYQIDGFRWLARLAAWGAGACLADDMGLGKTVQAIALMLLRAAEGPSLVVAPASVMPGWRAEIERFAPALRTTIINEAGTQRTEAIESAKPYDIVLTTYGLLIKEAEPLAAKQWNVICLDEAHTIKNKETKMSQAAMGLQGAARVMLTGTPLQNHLGEVWNLFQFANPGLLGTFQQFADRYIMPIEKEHDRERQRKLQRLIAPFILRRTKTDVLDELPEKTEITLRVDLSPAEQTLYEGLRREAERDLEEGNATAMQTLAAITRLRLAACHPTLVAPNLALPSSKTEALLQLVGELIAAGHRALIFSQFTAHLHLVRKALDDAHIESLYLDGSTPLTDRARLVYKFQTGNTPLFLISLKAGGLGLNLTAADYVLHLDPWWNPAIEDQASDRAYRMGQTRPVTVYRLIATGTIEEKILRLHATKKSLADALLEGTDMAHKLTRDDLLALLKENA